jgi:glycosyltransferase involved in cell wall biosynthesis
MRIFAITMQRNEDHCLEPWIRHHGYIFGFENICVLDHASSSPRTLAIISKYSALGVRIIRLPPDTKFDDKGTIVFEQFKHMQADRQADFIFPIDCDELLFLKRDTGSLTASREDVYAYIAQFQGFKGRLFIRENYLRILGHPGYFWPQPYAKVFFDTDACLGLDHGFHIGHPKDENQSIDTSFIYAHFHFKPYETNRQLSLEKLSPYVDVNNLNALSAYDGPGFHLKSHILSTKSEYEDMFIINSDSILCKDIDNHLLKIGIDPNFSDIVNDNVDQKSYDDINNDKKVLGIAITTYNRKNSVINLVSRIRSLTKNPFDLVICDDGSSDDTVSCLRSAGEVVLTGENRGIAWNKNRGIFYLMEIKKCDYIILLDDDVYPEFFGWDTEWIEASKRFGHVNFSLPSCREHIFVGESNSSCPGLTKKLGGCALAFTRYVLSNVGYMDPRFKKYGNEHTDLTIRAIRSGWGGIKIIRDGVEEIEFFVIDGGLAMGQSESYGTEYFVEESGHIWRSIMDDQVYRHAWRNDVERRDFLTEILGSIGESYKEVSIFKMEDYLSMYDDISRNGVEPLDHYIRFGITEGRYGTRPHNFTGQLHVEAIPVSTSASPVDMTALNGHENNDPLKMAAEELGLSWPLPPIGIEDFDWTNFEHPLKEASPWKKIA